MNQKLLWILNQHSGRGEILGKAVDCIAIFQDAGYDVTVHLTEGEKQTISYVKQYAAQYNRIVCAGGDGTLNAVVSGLMQIPDRPIVGYIPAGTTNDFASSLGVAKNPLKSAKTAVGHHLHALDIGSFNNRYFNYIAAFGIFTEASYATPQQQKNVFGRAAYIMEGMKSLANIKAVHLKIRTEGKKQEGDFFYGMVSNSTSVGGIKTIRSDEVRMDDGLYEVLLLRMPNGPLELQALVNDLLQNKEESEWYLYFRTADISFEADEPLPWTLDGEFGGNPLKAVVKNHCRAITFAVENSVASPAEKE